ncbi:MAG: phosphoglycerate kinase [Patescibacteria group bacterium]
MLELSRAKNLHGKTVLVRADFNVPIKNLKVVENFKIKKTLPTLNYLLDHGVKQIIIVSHLGRPNGVERKLSLAPVAKELAKLLHKTVGLAFLEDKKTGRVTLLENIRFIKGEERNEASLAKKLAEMADIFVLDGFAVAHRDAASVTGVSKYLPSYAGLLLEEELNGLKKIMEKPKRPMVAIIGGAKIETKISVINSFLKIADHILVGGAMFNTILWARGLKVGDSLVDKNFKKEAIVLLKNKKIILPVDVIVGDAKGKKAMAVDVDKNFSIKKGDGIYDIGPKTIRLFSKFIKKAKTIVWNGAMGRFEEKTYRFGTFSMAHLVASRSKGRAYGVCGGGETVEVLQNLGLMGQVDLVSTGGGAMIEFLSGKKLPGLKALKIYLRNE